MMQLQEIPGLIIHKSFDRLTPHELYAILKLRSEIFVVEQSCVFQDMDDKDQKSVHVMFIDGVMKGYARIVPVGISYPELSIGRVVTHQSIRGTGVGLKIMQGAISIAYTIFGKQPIRIGAQCYARKFYEHCGFVKSSEAYDEDGIPHIEMLLP